MKATISGQAGLAAVENRGKIHLYSVDEPGEPVAIDERQIAQVFGGATDMSVLDVDSPHAALTALKTSWQSDRLLQMLLLLLRKDVDANLKLEAVQVAEELMESQEASRFVRNRLFSRPLPEDADVSTATTIALRMASGNVSTLLWRLTEYQSAVTVISDAWTSIAAESPQPARTASLRRALETSGILYRLASSTDSFTLDVIETAAGDDARLSNWPETGEIVKRLADARGRKMPRQQNASDAQEVFLTHLEMIRRIVTFVCRQNRLSPEDGEDFASEVILTLMSDDYKLVRGFEGRSSFSTYMTTVIQRLFYAHRVEQWGKWRPSTEAKRLGPKAVTLERLLTRDQLSLGEACQFLTAGADADLTVADVEAIYTRLRARPLRPVRVAEQEAASVADRSRADDDLLITERQRLARAAAAKVDVALSRMNPEDQMILRMRFWQGSTASTIARTLNLDPKTLYRRIGRLLLDLRQQLHREGIGRADIDDLLLFRSAREPLHDIETGTPSHGSRPDDTMAATNRLLQAL